MKSLQVVKRVIVVMTAKSGAKILIDCRPTLLLYQKEQVKGREIETRLNFSHLRCKMHTVHILAYT